MLKLIWQTKDYVHSKDWNVEGVCMQSLSDVKYFNIGNNIDRFDTDETITDDH